VTFGRLEELIGRLGRTIEEAVNEAFHALEVG
jgi:hypothetical protein